MNNHLPDDLVHELRPAHGEPERRARADARPRRRRDATCCRSSTCSIRSAGSSGSRPAGRSRCRPAGRHWYTVPRVGYPEPETFAESYALLCALVDAIPEAFGVPASRTVLGGFSQGTVMSYALGLGAGRPRPAGIVALSGFIPTVDGWEPDLDGAAGLPVWISHGRRDPVISVEFARAARDLLTAGGLDVTYGETEAAHHVDPRAIAALPAWIEAAIERGGRSRSERTPSRRATGAPPGARRRPGACSRRARSRSGGSRRSPGGLGARRRRDRPAQRARRSRRPGVIVARSSRWRSLAALVGRPRPSRACAGATGATRSARRRSTSSTARSRSSGRSCRWPASSTSRRGARSPRRSSRPRRSSCTPPAARSRSRCSTSRSRPSSATASRSTRARPTMTTEH